MTDADVTRSRTVTWADPRAAASASRGLGGMALLQAMLDGKVPPPPIINLLGIEMGSIEAGRVVMRMMPGEYLYNPLGSVHGGALGTLLDTVMGCAVHTTLAAGRFYTTLELKVNFVRAVRLDTGEVTAEGKIVHSGRRSAVAEGRVTDEAGTLYATASTTCLVFDI